MSVTLESMTPAGAGAPLGVMVEADHKPGGTRSGVYVTDMGRALGHRLVVGPSGAGKFTAAIGPLLLTADQASAVVFDVADGEAVKMTAAHRAKLGPVLVLDPFGITGRRSGALNPLDLLRADDPDILTKATELAEALTLTVKTGGDADYWNGSAVKLLAVFLLHVATSPAEAGRRNLQRVREIIRRPFPSAQSKKPDDGTADLAAENAMVLAAMKLNPVAGGVVRDRAAKLEQAALVGADKNTFYVLETLDENTSFLDLPEVQRATATTDLDPSLLRSRVSTLYVVLPEHKLKLMGRWLRLIYTFVVDHLRVTFQHEDSAGRKGVPIHMVLDEFAAIGRFSRVKDDMVLVRRYGIMMHLMVQKLSQLASPELYGTGWEQMVPKYLHVLGSDEAFTSEYVSKRLGTTTRPNTSTSDTRSKGGGSQGTSKSWTEGPLVPPHEVDRLDPARCIVVIAGHDPLFLRKWHWWGSDYLSGRAGVTRRGEGGATAPAGGPTPSPRPAPAAAASQARGERSPLQRGMARLRRLFPQAAGETG